MPMTDDHAVSRPVWAAERDRVRQDLRVISAMSEAIGRGVGDTALAAYLQPALTTVRTAPVRSSQGPPASPLSRARANQRRPSPTRRSATERESR